MKKTLTALIAAAGVVGFASVAAADCSFHTAQISKPTTTADQSTPVSKPTAPETATN